MNEINDIVFNLKIANEKEMTLDLLSIYSKNGNELIECTSEEDRSFRRSDDKTISLINNFINTIDTLNDFISSNISININCAFVMISLNNKNQNLIDEYAQSISDINRFFNLSNADGSIFIYELSTGYCTDTMIGYIIPYYKYIVCFKPVLCDNKEPELIFYEYDDNYKIKKHIFDSNSDNEIDVYLSMLSLIKE